MLKNFPIMLNIMPMTIAIMPQFLYDFITRLAWLASRSIILGCSALMFDLLCSILCS